MSWVFLRLPHTSYDKCLLLWRGECWWFWRIDQGSDICMVPWSPQPGNLSSCGFSQGSLLQPGKRGDLGKVSHLEVNIFTKVPLGWRGNIVIYGLQKVLKSHVLLRQMTPGSNSVFHYELRRQFACTCHCLDIWRWRLVICYCGLWFLMKTWFSGFSNVLEIIQILLGFQKQLIRRLTWCTFTWWLRRSKVNQLSVCKLGN